MIEVATALNLRENEVSEYYRDYWNLRGMYDLNQIYEELREDIWSLVELHRRMKSESLSQRQVPRILKTTMTLEHNMSSSISPHELFGYTDKEDAIVKLLLDEAEQLFNRFVDAVTNRCINWMPNDKEYLRRYYRYLSYKMEIAIMKFWILETCPSLISCIMILPYKYFLLSKSQMTEVVEQTYYQGKTN